MTENECPGPNNCGWVESEKLLAKTFDSWRAEFRSILEDHRRDIQVRLDRIERELDRKSERESVDLLVRGIHDELQRHADEIRTLNTGLSTKASTDSLWKIAGLVVAIGGALSAIISTVMNYYRR